MSVPATKFIKSICRHVNAGYQVLAVNCIEENRCSEELALAVERLNSNPNIDADDPTEAYQLITWDVVKGFSHEENKSDCDPTLDLSDALVRIATYGDRAGLPKRAIIVMYDLHRMLQQNLHARRALVRAYESRGFFNGMHCRPIIMSMPTTMIHEDIVQCVSTVDFPLPDDEQLESIVGKTERLLEPPNADPNDTENPRILQPDLRLEIVRAMRGMTSSEADNAVAMAVATNSGWKPETVRTIRQEKSKAFEQSDTLRFYDPDDLKGFDSIAGYDAFVPYMTRQSRAFQPIAREAGLDFPKGVLLMGPPGTAKSVSAKAVAKLVNMPLLVFDIGAVFGSLVGESERRMRDALRRIEALRGCVLLVDEVDKAFANVNESVGDSGVGRRVFGSFLTWLAEKEDPTIVVVTLNRLAGIPTEFYRDGRFDERFYVDIPDGEVREEIFKIHMLRRHIDPEAYKKGQWKSLVEHTKDFVGSEIETVVKTAKTLAFDRVEEEVEALSKKGYEPQELFDLTCPTIDELLQAINDKTPQMRQDAAKKDLEKIRKLKGAARSVAAPPDTDTIKELSKERPLSYN